MGKERNLHSIRKEVRRNIIDRLDMSLNLPLLAEDDGSYDIGFSPSERQPSLTRERVVKQLNKKDLPRDERRILLVATRNVIPGLITKGLLKKESGNLMVVTNEEN